MNIKMLKAALAGLVLSVSGFANAGLINIDFSTLTQNTQHASFDGVQFSLIGGVDSSGNPYVTDGAIHNSNNSWYPTSQILQFSFANLLENIAFNVDNYGSGNGSFWTAFSADNVALETGSFSSGGGLFALTATNVSYLQFNNNYANYSWNFGVLSFSASEVSRDVPEPSTLAIFALGIFGLASRRFKKQ